MSQDLSIMQCQPEKKDSIKKIIGLQISLYYLFVFVLSSLTFYRLSILGIEVETIAPKDSVLNAVYMFGGILISTGILIILLKYLAKFPIVKIIEVLLTFLAISGFISLFLNDYISLIIGVLIIVMKEIWKNSLLRNLITSIIVGFIGGLMAYSLGLLPIVILIAIVAIYDYIAVFKTKHMVYLAQNIVDKNTVFVYDIKTGLDEIPKEVQKSSVEKESQNNFQISTSKKLRSKMNLGTGDFALPLIAIMKFTTINWILGIVCLLCVIIVLMITLFYLVDRPNTVALPAIPLQAIVILLFYFVVLLFF